MTTNVKQTITAQPPIYAGSCNSTNTPIPVDATTPQTPVVTIATRVKSNV